MNTTAEEKKLMIIKWDISEIVKYELEWRKECQADGEEALEGYTDEEHETEIWNDCYLFARETDQLEYDLDMMLDSFNKEKKPYKVNINNFGWRNQSGSKTLDYDINAHYFLKAILPQTECTFIITQYKDRIEILNYHHDSPTGETYYITLEKGEATV